MVKAVFVQNRKSIYQDQPGEVYHFPSRQYLSVVAQTIGDWVLFFESGKGGGRGYYAVQRVDRVVVDPADSTSHFAILDPPTELSFERLVARARPDGTLWESTLPPTGGKNSSAVRMISEADFAAIVTEGLRPVEMPETIPRSGDAGAFGLPSGFGEPTQAPFEGPAPLAGPRPEILVSRPFREASFARQVKLAYHARCAMSGLSLRNGGGRPEVEAAHIRPVAERGPDTVRNGLALSARCTGCSIGGFLALRTIITF